MLSQTVTIARNAFVESVRQPIYFVLVMLSGLAQLFSTWSTGFAMGYSETGEVSGDNKLLLDVGLGTVFVCGTLLAAFTATAVLSREIENKTALTVVSKPIARPAVVVGKYLGVAAAILMAVVAMLAFLMLGVRHGVLSNAGDLIDWPVITFGLAAVLGSVLVATWGNFFYGWPFTQTSMLVMAPSLVLAYLLTLVIGKQWQWQPPGTDLKPQIMLACVSLTMAIVVLTAVATAVSTRLGQVMTIVVCAGVFLFGLLSNHFVGRHVFQNQAIGIIKSAEKDATADPGWGRPGSAYTITFELPPEVAPRVGDPFYYGASPNGFPLAVREYTPFTGDVTDGPQLLGALTPPALVVSALTKDGVVVRRAGQDPLRYEREPRKGDYAFLKPTRINAGALAAWAVVPNMHHFWLLDAVSQDQPIPPGHVLLVVLYGVLQAGAFLAVGVALFQTRDVG